MELCRSHWYHVRAASFAAFLFNSGEQKMAEKIYLRPLGFLYGESATEAVKAGQARWLTGGPVAFSMAEIIEGTPGRAKRTCLAMSALSASSESRIQRWLSQLTEKRAAFCGMVFDRPRLMGIINVTPDSFSDGGNLHDAPASVAHAMRLVREGADIIDIGGESTRPGSDPVSLDQELKRVLPVVEGVLGVDALTSIDTRKSEVMRQAGVAGVDIINDVSALTYDGDSVTVAVTRKMPVILMHAKGDPKLMQDDPAYEDVCLEVFDYLEERIATCMAAGVPRANIVADPGIGFGKTVNHNLELLRCLALFHGLGVPILLGASRKRFIGALAGEPDPMKRGPGSVSAALLGLSQGVQMFRVHDVAKTRQAVAIWQSAMGSTEL